MSIQKTQRKNQRQCYLLCFRKLDLPHIRNRHQPDHEISNDVHDCIAYGKLLEIKARSLLSPECANGPAIEDGEEDHDNYPYGDQCDHAVDDAQETGMLENTSVEEEQ